MDVIDIIQIKEFGKEYAIYTLTGDVETYASILKENEQEVYLKNIEDEKELLPVVNNSLVAGVAMIKIFA